MSNTPWQTCKQAGVTCWECGHDDRCLVSPDGTAFFCQRDGKVHQIGKNALARTQRPDDYGNHAKPKAAKKTYLSAAEAIAAYGKGDPVATWNYLDAQSELVLTIARWNKPDGGKDVWPVSSTGTGWIQKGLPKGQLAPLYRLPELLAADLAEVVFVVEGEKCADAAAGIGLLSVTSVGGSGRAAGSEWTPLAGRDVGILPDNDEAGAKYSAVVAEILAGLDPPARVRVVNLPGLPDGGGDIVDYLDGQSDSLEPDDLKAGILRLAAAVATVEVERAGPIVTCLADVQAKEISWLWPGRIALGRITLLVGAPGCGKSYLTCDLAARVSTGTPAPDGKPLGRGSVILITGEDGLEDTILPRCEAHRADVSRIYHMAAVKRLDDKGKLRESMYEMTDVRTLEETLKRIPDCRLIVIDPIGSFLGGRTNSDKDNEVRSILAPVARIAEKCGAALLIVAHRRKSSGNTADELAMGSRAFTGISRAVWHLSRDKDNKERRLFLPGKNNLAPEGTGLAFTIQGQPTGAIVWERDPVRMTADEAVASEQGDGRPGPEPESRKAAEEWLTELLTAGPMASDKVKEQAKAAGMAWRTVWRAKDSLGVKAERCPFTSGWQWRLLKCATTTAKCATLGSLGDLGTLGSLENIPLNPPKIESKFELAREGCQVLTHGEPEHIGDAVNAEALVGNGPTVGTAGNADAPECEPLQNSRAGPEPVC